MPNWKKVIVSSSNAVLNNITASGHMSVLDSGFTVNTHSETELEVVGNISASGGGHIIATSISASDSIDVTKDISVGNNVTITNQLDVKYRKFTPPAQANFNYNGDVIYLGDTVGMTQSRIYAWNGSGWDLAQPNALSSGYRLLGITLGTTAAEGLLIRGFYNLNFNPGDNGNVAYLATSGMCTSIVPSVSGDISRVVGHIVGPNTGTGEIFFNPSTDWIEITD